MENIISKDNVYRGWIEELKKRIQISQIKAAIKVNGELLNLYWQLGEEITIKQKESNLGEAIIDQLSKDLTAAFPGMKGFSKRNLFYIRQWYLFYSEGHSKVPQLVAQLHSGTKSLSLPVVVPQLVAQIPWGIIGKSFQSVKLLKKPFFMFNKQLVTIGQELCWLHK